MRNLKRVLSLALASAMLLGTMVMGAGAADMVTFDKLTDKDKITNKEAVSLMVDLGIAVGKPDGSFAPAKAINRATMAQLITYVMMGDVDASLFKGTTAGTQTSDDYTLTADGNVTVTVGIADDVSGAIEVYTYTIAVSGKTA